MNPCEVLLDTPMAGREVLVEYDSTIAVIEADEAVRSFLCECLHRAGFRVWSEPSAEEFCLRLLHETTDLVVMAAGHPGSLGASLTARLETAGIPVIVLDGASEEPEHPGTSRHAGGALHMRKPVTSGALLAAVDALRGEWLTPPASPGLSAPAGVPWLFDSARRCLISPFKDIVPLTSRESDLMRCLAKTPGNLVSKRTVAEAMGVTQTEGGFHRIEANLSRLRKKVRQVTGLPMPVNSVFGEGLIFFP